MSNQDDGHDIVGEIEDWLADDIVGEIDYIACIARLAVRPANWHRPGVVIPRPSEKYRSTMPIGEATPADLRAVADAHDASAGELLDDARQLREVADQIEKGIGLGPKIADHLRTMREEGAHRDDERERAYAIARSDDGVFVSDAVCRAKLEWPLFNARILTVEDVHASIADGSILRVKGVGPARFAKLTQGLSQEEASR